MQNIAADASLDYFSLISSSENSGVCSVGFGLINYNVLLTKNSIEGNAVLLQRSSWNHVTTVISAPSLYFHSVIL